MKRVDLIMIAVSLGVLMALQYAVGGFPIAFFSFPLNIILVVIWLLGLWMLYKDYRQTAICRYLLSLRATVVTLSLVIAFCLVLGMVPQYPSDSLVRSLSFWERLGVHQITTSWYFLFSLLLLQSHLTLITLRGYRNANGIRWRFVASHLGLGLTLIGGFWGSADTAVYRIPVYRQEATNTAYSSDGGVHYIAQSLQLQHFEVSYFDNGMPRKYEANISVNGHEIALRVNEPHAIGFGEDLYLTGYDMRQKGDVHYCVLQLVRQPWKYVQLSGILMMLLSAVALFIKGPKRKKETR